MNRLYDFVKPVFVFSVQKFYRKTWEKTDNPPAPFLGE